MPTLYLPKQAPGVAAESRSCRTESGGRSPSLRGSGNSSLEAESRNKH